MEHPAQQLVDHLFRREAGKMVSFLSKILGFSQLSLAEDMVQETLAHALVHWRAGAPDNPEAWLYRVVKNKLLDHLRREKNWQERIAPGFLQQLNLDNSAETAFEHLNFEHEIEDSQLRMMFACCHPAIPEEAQLILILKTLCGLSVREIAAALLSSEEAVAKRLFRAKEKIRTEHLELEPPVGPELSQRLEAVLKVVYLLFNEGYYSVSDDAMLRLDLCREALRLSALLAGHPLSNAPKTQALAALLCFQASRFDARLDAQGDIIVLQDQNRSLWDQDLIRQGYWYFQRSASGNEVSAYHLEAAIASYHAASPDFASTNWQAVFHLYELLCQINASPVAAMNRAIALGYFRGAAAGIEALLNLENLGKNHIYQVALGDFYAQNEQPKQAEAAYRIAEKLVNRAAERRLIGKKLEGLVP
ncbi:MAG: sigma-70 family RNA polymerase sigma factor [Bacteroidota bacterium]